MIAKQIHMHTAIPWLTKYPMHPSLYPDTCRSHSQRPCSCVSTCGTDQEDSMLCKFLDGRASQVPAEVKKLLAVCCTTTTVTSTVVEVDFMNSVCIHDHECTPRSLGTYAWGTIKMANLDPKPKVPECCLREMLPIPFLLKTVRKFHKPVKWEEPHLHKVQRLTAVGLTQQDLHTSRCKGQDSHWYLGSPTSHWAHVNSSAASLRPFRQRNSKRYSSQYPGLLS